MVRNQIIQWNLASIFQLFNTFLIWKPSLLGTLTREKYSHYYDNNIESKWKPLNIKDITASKSQSFIIRRIQFPIQFAIARTDHCFQGLSLDELVFEPNMIKKHRLTYITFSCIQTKKNYFLLNLLFNMKVFMCIQEYIWKWIDWK
jgi:hypothetical protein